MLHRSPIVRNYSDLKKAHRGEIIIILFNVQSNFSKDKTSRNEKTCLIFLTYFFM